MTITLKSKIENGSIRLPKKIDLPEGTRVIVRIEPVIKAKEKQKIISELSGSWSGDASIAAIFKAMYGEEWDKAFIVAAKSYLDGGWYDEAKEVLEMGIHYFPHSQEMEDILVKLQVGGMSKS